MHQRFTTQAYIEAFRNSDLLAPELRHLYVDAHFEREGLAVVGKNMEFSITDSKRFFRLTTPLSGEFERPAEHIVAREAESRRCEFLTEGHYLPHALTVFDSMGRSYTLPGLLQEQHTPLLTFVRHHCSTAHRPHLRNGLESLWHCANLLSTTTIAHGALTKANICFDPHCNVRLSDYPIAPPEGRSDIVSLSKAALLIYIGGSELEAYKIIVEQNKSGASDPTRTLRHIASAAEHHGVTSLTQVATLLLNRANDGALLEALRHLSAEPFVPLPLLTKLLRTRQHPNIAIAPTPLPQPPEEYATIDFQLCDEVMAASDLIVRYRKGSYWGYAHYDGTHIAVEKPLIGATDFEEGRAVVRTTRGYGLIDSCGHFVLGDHWSQMCWYANENIVAAADNQGRWHIYNRMGHQLSAVPCDWMGDASEGFVVARRGNKYGYFTVDGLKRTDFIYDQAYGFAHGVARVQYGNNHYHINTSFHRLSPRLERRLEESLAEDGHNK